MDVATEYDMIIKSKGEKSVSLYMRSLLKLSPREASQLPTHKLVHFVMSFRKEDRIGSNAEEDWTIAKNSHNARKL